MNDLAEHIQALRMIDTHEHLDKESEYVEDGHDILQDLFENYIQADLVVAGATEAAVTRLFDHSDPDLRALCWRKYSLGALSAHWLWRGGAVDRAAGLWHRRDYR